MEIVFATSNSNKIKEINQLLPDSIAIAGLKDIGCTEEVPETQATIEGNAIQKAQYIYDNYGEIVLQKIRALRYPHLMERLGFSQPDMLEHNATRMTI